MNTEGSLIIRQLKIQKENDFKTTMNQISSTEHDLHKKHQFIFHTGTWKIISYGKQAMNVMGKLHIYTAQVIALY